jgi:hypothetical protein
MADNWYLFNNSKDSPELVANSIKGNLKLISREYFDFFLNSTKEDK